MERLVVIINPKAGTDKIKAYQNILHEELGQCFQLNIVLTQYAGHAIKIAEEAVTNKCFGVIVIGGDGSANEVAQALVGSQTALGIIPKGSGNGLARSLHIDLKFKEALNTIKKKNLESIDVGLVNDDHYFLSNLGVGFDVKISKDFKETNFRGFWGYTKLIAKNIVNFKPQTFKLTIDNKIFYIKAFLLNIANAEQFGFNFKIAPKASLQDGIFDIVAIKKFPLYYSPALLLQAFSGQLYKNKFVTKWNGKSIQISHPKLNYYQVDGDVVKNKFPGTVNVKVLSHALNVFKP